MLDKCWPSIKTNKQTKSSPIQPLCYGTVERQEMTSREPKLQCLISVGRPLKQTNKQNQAPYNHCAMER